MRKITTFAGVLAMVLVLSSSAGGQSEVTSHADLITYNRLLTQVKHIDQQYQRELANAMNTARKRDGEADLETKARLLSLRDQRDRVMSRMTMLALRHGWALPNSGADGAESAASAVPTPHQEVFKGADHIIRARFEQEAAQIARAVELPLVAPPASFGAYR